MAQYRRYRKKIVRFCLSSMCAPAQWPSGNDVPLGTVDYGFDPWSRQAKDGKNRTLAAASLGTKY